MFIVYAYNYLGSWYMNIIHINSVFIPFPYLAPLHLWFPSCLQNTYPLFPIIYIFFLLIIYALGSHIRETMQYKLQFLGFFT